jgi:UDPglucose 6-dehydrogenase
MEMLEAVIEVNQNQPAQVLGLLRKHFPSFDGLRVAVLGLAFKPGTDDVRESPAIPVVNALLAEGAQINAYDPIATHEARKLFGDTGITYHMELSDALAGVQAVVIMTRWDELRALPGMLVELEPQPLLVDGRRMLDKRSVARYEGIGL